MQVVAVAAAAVVAVMASMARRGVPVQTARQIWTHAACVRDRGRDDHRAQVFTCDCERPGKREERIQSPEIMPARCGAGIDRRRKALEPGIAGGQVLGTTAYAQVLGSYLIRLLAGRPGW